jgi:hypothetical protein
MTYKEQGRVFMQWIRAYLECLTEERPMQLVTLKVREKQLRLFK